MDKFALVKVIEQGSSTRPQKDYVSGINYFNDSKKLFFSRKGPDVITWDNESDASAIRDMFSDIYRLDIICYTQ